MARQLGHASTLPRGKTHFTDGRIIVPFVGYNDRCRPEGRFQNPSLPPPLRFEEELERGFLEPTLRCF